MQTLMTKQKTEQKQFVYIIISKTATGLASLIRFFTHYEYNHASISFSEDLGYMYSYARYNYHTPLSGGFVEETVKRFDYRMKRPSKIKVYRLTADTEQFNSMMALVEDMQQNGSEYIYDTLGAMGIRFGSNPHCFTCIGFVTHLLKISGLLPQRKKPYTIHEIDDMLAPYLVFSGELHDFAQDADPTDKAYFDRKGLGSVIADTFRHFIRLFKVYIAY